MDLKPQLTHAAFSLYHTRHPRKMTSLTAMTSLDNALHHVDSRTQHKLNMLGISYSKKVVSECIR